MRRRAFESTVDHKRASLPSNFFVVQNFVLLGNPLDLPYLSPRLGGKKFRGPSFSDNA